MALFCIVCTDKPGVLDQRLAIRAEHVAYLRTRLDIIRLAGPRYDEAGRMCGSLFVVETDDEAAARDFTDADPFTRAGVFGSVDVTGFNATMGSWLS